VIFTPFGQVEVHRHVYQASGGGATYSPADRKAGLVCKCSPRMVKLLTSDYCEGSAAVVVSAFAEHHHVAVSRDLVRRTSLLISEHVKEIEDRWTYALPEEVDLAEVAVMSISRDGVMVNLLDGKAGLPKRKAGYREAMCGVICLYDKDQKLLHTVYQGVGPQKGKAAFTRIFEQEVQRMTEQLARAGADPVRVGLADGAPANWEQLTPLTDCQATDYYHVTERVHKLAAILPLRQAQKSAWARKQKGTLLEQPNGAELVVKEAQKAAELVKTAKRQEIAAEQVTYLANQQHRMHYHEMREAGLPIGSGTVEAGCKTLVKQRLGGAGMRWLNCHADDMIVVRALKLTPGRYEQYWRKRIRYVA
jgi:hypothetical protein